MQCGCREKISGEGGHALLVGLIRRGRIGKFTRSKGRTKKEKKSHLGGYRKGGGEKRSDEDRPV